MQRIIIIVLVLAVVLGFMVTYTVRFNEQAVVTTFGKADESSVVKEPGLRLKWPYPFQKVATYDTRIRFVEADQETQATADANQVVMTTFVTWRVSDPLKFYKAFGGAGEANISEHYGAAEKKLKSQLRQAASAVSQFRLNELLSADLKASKLDALEGAMLAQMQGAEMATYGIEAKKVGVSGLTFPQATSTVVFNAMREARKKIANSILSQGTSEASRIRSEAENNAKKIQDFATQLAAGIRSQGETEAAQFYAQMKQDPQLAVFIQNMDFLRTVVTKRMTLVIPTKLPGLELLSPDAAKTFGSGRPPTPALPDFIKAKVDAGTVSEPGHGQDAHATGGAR